MSTYSYSTQVSAPAPAPSPGGATFAYTSEVTQQILQAPAEAVPSGYIIYAGSGGAAAATAPTPLRQSYTTYAPGQNDDVVGGLMTLEGEADSGDARAGAIVQQAKLLELSTQHGQGPIWEKKDHKHRIGELLIAAWDIYRSKTGSNNERDFFHWLDNIPEWERVVMLSRKIREMGTMALGTQQQRNILKRENAHPDADVKNELNLRPSVIKAFVNGVKYLDAASRPSYVVSIAGGRATYRGGAFDTGMMQTVFSGKGFGIWVMDGDGTLYAGNHVYGQMHHSSFVAGGGILAGGEIRARSGKIEFISGKSGHYCPPIDNLISALKKLRLTGIDSDALRVLVWDKFSGPTSAKVVHGDTVLADGGKRYTAWGHLKLEQKAWLQAGNYDQFQ